ncbi:hypothetical protein AMAG_00887 [Allomyces macrogynus ATCC 38327]|uniref:Uncharacterized protein n=1 Tax=Allomyces macrogynus (strain ATCC 38327) TaxID=578462 RepID=A0A0L0RY13_ALLM3|nr:hypothetical protein AMAG_00887 [Allomyces macrogynus ATCC 38327]|eukprot:KNE54946.1 hypothetical protein AMAG_00887 [Allomyces macrogynus ATCC 38327]
MRSRISSRSISRPAVARERGLERVPHLAVATELEPEPEIQVDHDQVIMPTTSSTITSPSVTTTLTTVSSPAPPSSAAALEDTAGCSRRSARAIWPRSRPCQCRSRCTPICTPSLGPHCTWPRPWRRCASSSGCC